MRKSNVRKSRLAHTKVPYNSKPFPISILQNRHHNNSQLNPSSPNQNNQISTMHNFDTNNRQYTVLQHINANVKTEPKGENVVPPRCKQTHWHYRPAIVMDTVNLSQRSNTIRLGCLYGIFPYRIHVAFPSRYHLSISRSVDNQKS